MVLYRQKGHLGAYPSMWDTVFPQRSGGAEYQAELQQCARSAPAGTGNASEDIVPSRHASRKKTPFDWSEVSQQYQIPEYAKMKGMRSRMATRAKSRSKSRDDKSRERSLSGERSAKGILREEENVDFHWPRELNEKMFKQGKMPGYDVKYDWAAPDGSQNGMLYDTEGRKCSQISDAIKQISHSENYIRKLRERNTQVHERAAEKHQQRAREIERSVRHYFLPPRPSEGQGQGGSSQGHEVAEPGRISRADSTLIASNAGWRTKAVRKFQKEYRAEFIPDFLPKFSHMADIGLHGTVKN